MNHPVEIISWTGDIEALATVLRVPVKRLRSIAKRGAKERLIINAAPANHEALMSAVWRQLAAADGADWP